MTEMQKGLSKTSMACVHVGVGAPGMRYEGGARRERKHVGKCATFFGLLRSVDKVHIALRLLREERER